MGKIHAESKQNKTLDILLFLTRVSDAHRAPYLKSVPNAFHSGVGVRTFILCCFFGRDMSHIVSEGRSLSCTPEVTVFVVS